MQRPKAGNPIDLALLAGCTNLVNSTSIMLMNHAGVISHGVVCVLTLAGVAVHFVQLSNFCSLLCVSLVGIHLLLALLCGTLLCNIATFRLI